MIQSIPEGVDSKFRLVLLIARRAEQLMRGARPKLETDRPLKPTRLAATEFEENQVALEDTMNDLIVGPALDPGLFKHGQAGQSLSLRISF